MLAVTDRDASALIARAGGGRHRARVARTMASVQRHGTTHLVAISGMHVTLFAGGDVCAGAEGVEGGCDAERARRGARRRVCVGERGAAGACGRARCCCIGDPTARATRSLSLPRDFRRDLWVRAGLPGMPCSLALSVPTERTLIMLGVWLFARSIARASHPFQPFALALLLVLLVDPFAPPTGYSGINRMVRRIVQVKETGNQPRVICSKGRINSGPSWRSSLWGVQGISRPLPYT